MAMEQAGSNEGMGVARYINIDRLTNYVILAT
jgi:hypothetical protein